MIIKTIALAAAVAHTATFAAAPAGVPVQAKKPNVIIVMTDDQGYGDLASTGNSIIRTPHMDRLASEGVRFSNFHVDAYCAPTRAALMTGHYSHRCGIRGTASGNNMLHDREVTMADIFRHNGYRTGIFGKWHLGASYPYRPIDRGFDEWLGHGDGGTGWGEDAWGNDRVNDRYFYNGVLEEKPRPGYEGDVFFDAAMEFIRTNKSRPFLTYLALYNPHHPWSIPDPKWAAPYTGKVPAGIDYFYASIARIDHNLGRLRDLLKQEGLADNTVLIFMSDNGTTGGDKIFNAGMRAQKGSAYDGGHRVPCFLHWPKGGYDKPIEVSRITAHLDILPTLIDLCGLALPKPVRFDGTSLKPLLADPKAAWLDRTLVMGAPRNNTTPKFGVNCAVMTDRWRLVQNRELYDMVQDPGQENDIAATNPQTVQQMRDAYKHYWNDVSADDKDWRGRPIIGSAAAPETELCAADGATVHSELNGSHRAIAAGQKALVRWPIRVAETGTYRIELRRWPKELNAPIAGQPQFEKSVDAYLPGGKPVTGLVYGGDARGMVVPVARVRLKIGDAIQEIAVSATDTVAVFNVKLEVGTASIETALLDKSGKPLCSAYYASIRKNQ